MNVARKATVNDLMAKARKLGVVKKKAENISAPAPVRLLKTGFLEELYEYEEMKDMERMENQNLDIPVSYLRETTMRLSW